MARFWMLCMPMMADWGGLMMGVDSMEPYTPPLLMVNVPPAMSSMAMVPSRAFLPSMLMFCVEGVWSRVSIEKQHHEIGQAHAAAPSGTAAAGGQAAASKRPAPPSPRLRS
jgi:hypothetical protein